MTSNLLKEILKLEEKPIPKKLPLKEPFYEEPKLSPKSLMVLAQQAQEKYAQGNFFLRKVKTSGVIIDVKF